MMHSAHPGESGQLEVLTRGDCRGLVEAAHALIDATLRKERGALDGDSERLEVCEPELRSQSRGLAAAAHRDLEVRVDFECVVALDEQQPPVLGAGRVPRKQGPGPLDPAAGYRLVAQAEAASAALAAAKRSSTL
jgi:hypothetical protein